jgi:ribosomal protein S18 acetylase RimI-like enzyme
MEPEIEIIGPDQWQGYREIRLKSLKTDPTAFGRSYEEEVNFSEEDFRKKLAVSNRFTYIAKVNDKIIALVASSLEQAGNVRHTAEIHGVFVDPDFRNRGVGFKLMKRVLDDLYQNSITSRVILSANNENIPAIKMYEKLGFVKCGLGTKQTKVNGRYYDGIQMELIFEDKL